MAKNINYTCFTSSTYSLASRSGLTEIQGADLKNQGKDLKWETVSVMSTKRRRDRIRTDLCHTVVNSQIEGMSGRYTLHWDGKHLKKLTHTGLPEERVAVLLVGATDKILLGVPKIDNVCIKFNFD